MKRKYLLLVLTTSCLTALVFYACRKNELQSASSSMNNKEVISVSKAKEWFYQKHAADIEIVNELQKSTGQRMTSLSKGSFAGIPDWSQYHENAEGSINVAMGYGYFSNTDKVYFRDLVVSYDQDGYLKELIEQVEFDSAYLKQQIGVTGLKEHLRSYIDKSNFTGKVSLYTISNQLLKAAVFENGELKHYLVSSSNIMGIASTVGGRTYSSLPVYSAAGGEVVTDPDLPDIVLPPGRKPNPGGGFWWPPFPGGGGGGGMPPGPGPGYGGAGGYSPPTPPTPENPDDPCAKAAKAAQNAKNTYDKQPFQEALAKIKEGIADRKVEKGFALMEKISVDPRDRTKISSEKVYTGNIVTGTETDVTVPTSTSYLEALMGTVHSHPANGYTAPSPVDIYGVIESFGANTSEFTKGRFIGNFVVAADGSTYVLTIADQTLATTFLATKNANLDGNGWKEDSEIGKAFEEAKAFYEKKFWDSENKDNLVYENTMAAVMGKFKTGVTLIKRNQNTGQFEAMLREKKSEKKWWGTKKEYVSPCP